MTLLWWLAYIAQPIIMGITGWIVWQYTRETKRLRETAQQQISVSQQQVKATQEQIETMQRPFVVIAPKWNEGRLQTFIVRNIGNSAAVNVELIYGQYKLMIPIIDSKEAMTVGVQEDSDIIRDINATLEFPEDWLVFTLDTTSLSKGVIMKIEYCNVAMMQYHTTQKILPERVVIESSGAMGVYNPFT